MSIRTIMERLREQSRDRRRMELRRSLQTRVQLMEWSGVVFISLDGLPIRQVTDFDDVREILDQTRDDLFNYIKQDNEQAYGYGEEF